jgi:TPP-dependent pyruvate/acetoin dehydrogenase alpha subunit
LKALNTETTKSDLSLYEALLLAREAEELISQEYHKDEMKTPMHLGIGSEAIGVGVLKTVPASSKVFGTYRNHVHYLTKTNDTDLFFKELFGRAGGAAKGKAGSMHLSLPEKNFVMTSAVVSTTIPVAVGAALANDYLGKKEDWAVVFFGDGAIEEGVFWESLNFAVLKKLKVLFVCEDNELAIHTFKKDRQGYKSLQQIIEGYGAHYVSGNGRDVFEVAEKTKQALLLNEQNSKPVFMHLDYFRMIQHVGPGEDFSAGYREKPTAMEENNDPVILCKKLLISKGVTEKELSSIRDTVLSKLRSSLELARKDDFADPEELFKDVFFEGNKK